jgi:hypothetical protein
VRGGAVDSDSAYSGSLGPDDSFWLHEFTDLYVKYLGDILLGVVQ